MKYPPAEKPRHLTWEIENVIDDDEYGYQVDVNVMADILTQTKLLTLNITVSACEARNRTEAMVAAILKACDFADDLGALSKVTRESNAYFASVVGMEEQDFFDLIDPGR